MGKLLRVEHCGECPCSCRRLNGSVVEVGCMISGNWTTFFYLDADDYAQANNQTPPDWCPLPDALEDAPEAMPKEVMNER